MVNQDAHKFLRRNKPGIRLAELQEPPINYQRPRGFQLIPHLLSRSDQIKPKQEKKHSVNFIITLKNRSE